MSGLVDPIELVQRHIGDIPVPVFEILQQLGLGPEYEVLSDNISGAIKATNGNGYRVVLNSAHPRVRQRFTAAHELGHYIYHRDLLGHGTGDTRAYRAEGTAFPNPSIRPIHERQANSFAANILMPQASIARLRRQGVTAVADLAHRLDVSEDAMRIRLGLPRLI